VFDVDPALRLLITRPMPPLSPALEARVGVHWERALQARPLFNGQVFCADRITSRVIEGHWTEYRRLLAQITEPALFPLLQVRALAVCGALCSPDGVVAARREPGSVYQPGLWQLPPAGSVDAGAATADGADWRLALLAELGEELGLSAADVHRLRPLCLVQHPSGVLDLGVQMDTRRGAEAIHAAHRMARHGEYDRLLIAPAADLPGEVARAGGVLVPSAAHFLRRLDLGKW